uniref:Palmitoyltransferase n=1 Tax=Heterorhabditis bacteriophora TaxID=37862 RepID=A0A1I7WMG1_HETBA
MKVTISPTLSLCFFHCHVDNHTKSRCHHRESEPSKVGYIEEPITTAGYPTSSQKVINAHPPTNTFPAGGIRGTNKSTAFRGNQRGQGYIDYDAPRSRPKVAGGGGNPNKIVRINISNLAPSVVSPDLEELFADYNIETATVHYNETGISVGTADIFLRKRDAEKVLQHFKGVALDGQVGSNFVNFFTLFSSLKIFCIRVRRKIAIYYFRINNDFKNFCAHCRYTFTTIDLDRISDDKLLRDVVAPRFNWRILSPGSFFFWNYSTMVNMVRSSFTGAGFVPKNWTPKNIQSTCYDSLLQWCEPCEGYKAPRSHHCSKCSRCSLKMDHHCPWINNCVGHRNHAFFFRFLISAICGCVHALVIQIFCFYHAIHLGFYLHFGSGSEPLIYVTFWSFIALVAASAFSVGVTIGLSGLLYLQVKYIRNNKTGIEEYIDQKAISCRDDDDVKWIYPYDLGWKRNVREVLGSWSGKTAGNGVWWPVVKGCDQFTLTREQLYQKELKKNHARLVHIERDFNGGFLGSLRIGCRVFICQPLSDEPRIKVNCGEHWVITRGQNHWFYGYCKGEEKRKGWFPRVCAVLIITINNAMDLMTLKWVAMFGYDPGVLILLVCFIYRFYAQKTLISIVIMNHIDVDQLLEDYAWTHFKDIQSLRKTRLDDFKSLEKDDCEFVINRKNLVCINEEPQYSEFIPVGAKPYTLFKSIYTNNTNRCAVPPHYCTEASIVIEEMNYRGSYSVTTKLSGTVVVSVRRRKDGALVLPIRVNIVEVFRSHLDSPHCKKEVKQVATVEQNKVVRLLSKGTCHFQFAMKQRIDLKENALSTGKEIMID